MKLIPFRLLVIALPAALIPAAYLQAAYNPSIVAADARWVVYADFNALRASVIGKELIEVIEKTQRETTNGVIGLNVPKVLATVGSVTAYGSNLSKDPKSVDGALVAQGTADLRKIAESVLLQGTLAQPDVFTELKDLPFPAYGLNDPKAPEGSRTQLIFAFPPEPVVLIGKSKATLVKAHEVFRGSAPSLAKARTSELAKLEVKASDAYLFAASVVPAEPIFPQNAPQARVLQLAHAGAVAVGERGPDLFADAQLMASSEANAEKLMKILQGLTAMLSLAESNDRELGQFLNSTAVTRESDTVALHLAYPTERLVQMTQTLVSRAEARPVHRQPPLTHGAKIAEWSASEDATVEGENALASHTIENVRLVNGATISVGRWVAGGRPPRIDRVEIVAADGPPLVFKNDFMRNFRGTMVQFAFPGTDGAYTIKVMYAPDPERAAKLAVSVRDPNAPEEKPSAGKGPLVPQPKWTR